MNLLAIFMAYAVGLLVGTAGNKTELWRVSIVALLVVALVALLAHLDKRSKWRRDPFNGRIHGCGCKDASRHNSCKGLPDCYLRADHPERKHSK